MKASRHLKEPFFFTGFLQNRAGTRSFRTLDSPSNRGTGLRMVILPFPCCLLAILRCDGGFVWRTWTLTWVRQDGVGLRQELVAADPLVSFSAPVTENKASVTSQCSSSRRNRAARSSCEWMRAERQGKEDNIVIFPDCK